jgi:hypothetical protein
VLDGTERLVDEETIDKLDEDISAIEDDVIAEADEVDVEDALELELLDRPVEEDVRAED